MKLTCAQCGKEFDFSEGEQKFYKQNGYAEPKRCKGCRKFHDGGNRGMKTSTFYQNSQLYGAKEEVTGGTYNETAYMVRLKLNNNVVFVRSFPSDSQLDLVSDAVGAGKFNEIQSNDIAKRLSGYKEISDITIEVTQVYKHIRLEDQE